MVGLLQRQSDSLAACTPSSRKPALIPAAEQLARAIGMVALTETEPLALAVGAMADCSNPLDMLSPPGRPPGRALGGVRGAVPIGLRLPGGAPGNRWLDLDDSLGASDTSQPQQGGCATANGALGTPDESGSSGGTAWLRGLVGRT